MLNDLTLPGDLFATMASTAYNCGLRLRQYVFQLTAEQYSDENGGWSYARLKLELAEQSEHVGGSNGCSR